VDPVTGVATLRFNQAAFGGIAPDSCYGAFASPFIDGLAYDASDDTLWLSGDAALTIYHVTTAGAFIGSSATPIHPDSAAPGCNTGITVAPGGFLELAMQTDGDLGPHRIAKVSKADPTTIIVSFVALATDDPGIEDLSYDGNTFAPLCVVWSNQFGGTNLLTAWDVQCTRTIGYWKNHADDAILPQTLGDGSDVGFCQVVDTPAKVEGVMKAAKSKEAAYMLKAQLLAAKLNVAMGDIPPVDLAAIGPTITAADALLSLSGCTPLTGKGGADRAAATALIAALDAFNNLYSP